MNCKEMAYHKLLARQLKKYACGSLMDNPDFIRFIDVVNDSYMAYDRDKELSDHAFTISQEEFSGINDQLKEEVELRKFSIKRLKHALNEIKTAQASPMTDSDNDLLEIVDVLNVEITRRKEAEEMLVQATEEAIKASMAKTEFLSIISHEIRTPLNAILGMGHLLLKNHPRLDQLDNLRTLKTSADNLLMLINDILDFNKIEAGRLEIEEAPFNVKKLIKDIAGANTFAAEERGNSLLLNIDEHIPEHCLGDSLRLGQIFNNLVSNAVKFTHRGKVTINATLKDLKQDTVTIFFSVEDTGVGIAAEKLNGIFLPFTQASTSITREYGGTGLGLAITKSLLEFMGSEIRVKSEPQKGSVFFFTLSLKLPLHPLEEQFPSDIHYPDLTGKNILLVEDTIFNVMYATQLLEDQNAGVKVAENGAVAVDIMKTQACDLVLMDLQMPVMDGYTATKKIREFNNKVPIIALTASASENVKDRVLATGMQDYITKPFNPDDFFLKIRKYLA